HVHGRTLPLPALLFFFSSRRRHTRSKRDWSSDVCSSDLIVFPSSSIPSIKTRRNVEETKCATAMLSTSFHPYNRSPEGKRGILQQKHFNFFCSNKKSHFSRLYITDPCLIGIKSLI